MNENVYSPGVQARPADALHANTGFVEAELPQLVLPLGKTVQLDLRTRDVNHSFWVIDFLYKKDLIAGQTNYENFTPTRLGTYQGKCAELCGEYHSRMLFTREGRHAGASTARTSSTSATIGNTGQLGQKYNKDDSSGAQGTQYSGDGSTSETKQLGNQ